jgi:hypothetical protein
MRRPGLLVLASVLLAASTFPALAQTGRAQDSLRFRFGAFVPTGAGEFWENNEAVFTLDHSDFDDWMFGTSFVTAMSNHVEFGFNIDYYDATVRSEYRDFVDQFGNPILHDSRLRLVPVTLDLRFLPGGRYGVRGEFGDRQVRKPCMWLGVGGGANFWEYEEVGDFVGGVVPTVVSDRLVDDGIDPEWHAMIGFELPVGPNWAWTLEGRYSWSDVEIKGDFEDLELGEVDLSGASVFAGMSFQF